MFIMSEELSERVNLPLSPEMYRAVKERAAAEGNSAVGFIRHCIVQELSRQPKIYDLEKRLECLEHAFRAADLTTSYAEKTEADKKGRTTAEAG